VPPLSLAAFEKAVHGRADARPVAIVRLCTGLAALIQAQESWRTLAALSDPASLRLPLLPGLPSPAGPLAANLIMALWCAAAASLALGFRTRISGLTLAAVLGYTLCLDQQLYSNHQYLMILLATLLALGTGGAVWSADAARSGARATVPGWLSLCLRVQLTLVYLFGALSKLNPTYLNGVILAGYLRPELLRRLPNQAADHAVVILAVAAVLTELFLAFALWSPRLRRWALLAGVGLHGAMLLGMTFDPGVVVFGLLSLGLYAPFFAPSPVSLPDE